MKKLTKTATFTDIHWGAKNNSEQHNSDCMAFIDWFCDTVRNDKLIDSIVFLGDWFENRAALNISTMNWSYHGAKKLNDLGLPIFFVIGNHDLYHRHTRDVISTINYHEFNNFQIIDHPTIVTSFHKDILMCPYLFSQEYVTLTQYLHLSTWWGHFEFKGFVVTGQTQVMHHGQAAEEFVGPKYIFSGHFHKRQSNGNVVYIGNALPSTFGDANDYHRGMMVYDHVGEKVTFIDWDDCPKYTKVLLSNLVNNFSAVKLYSQSRVRCVVDEHITYEDLTKLKHMCIEKYNLREFSMEETQDIQKSIEETDTEEIEELTDEEFTNATLDDLILIMLQKVSTDTIDTKILCEQYNRLKV